jgi:nucleoside-diphosphate-sugar epimerase
MRILITGVNGLLGYDLAKLLCKKQSNVVFGLSRSNGIIKAENYHHIIADLTQNDFEKSLPGPLDAVIHLAQSEKFRDFPSAAMDVFKTNTLSTLKLLNYSQTNGVGKFIYASSGGVYGNKDIGFTEESPVIGSGDLGFYLSTKLCSEILADNYTNYFTVVQLRLFFMYGERQNKTMLIPRLINSVRMGQPIMLNGSEGIRINPIYVADAALAVEKALMLNHSDKINIGGPEDVSIKQIADSIAQKIGKMPVFEHNDIKAKNLIGDIGKMKRLLSDPKTNISTGLQKCIF